MADSKNADKKSKRPKTKKAVITPDKEPTKVVNKEVAEKKEDPKELDEINSSSDDSIWPSVSFDTNSNDSDKQEVAEASRKRFREKIYKVINKMSPALSSFMKAPTEQDDSKTADEGNIKKGKKESKEKEDSVVPLKKQKKK